MSSTVPAVILKQLPTVTLARIDAGPDWYSIALIVNGGHYQQHLRTKFLLLSEAFGVYYIFCCLQRTNGDFMLGIEEIGMGVIIPACHGSLIAQSI